MQYLFFGFCLDTTKKELSHKSQLVELTKQNYQLLFFFVKNPANIVDKDKLIEEVWNGRVVADNTIDQSIYKLKKILTSISEAQYFETIYGQGIKFVPQVEIKTIEIRANKHNEQIFYGKNQSKTIYSLLAFIALLIISTVFWINQHTVKFTDKIPQNKNMLLIIPNSGDNTESNWLSDSSSSVIEKYLSYSNSIKLKNYKDKPENLNTQQYLETQWKLYPHMSVVTSDIELNDNTFTVSLSINNQQQVITQSFQDDNLTLAINSATQWLTQQMSKTYTSNTTITHNSHVLELYMRGLASLENKDHEQSIGYFEMCLKQDPDYHMATLELSQLMDRKGNQIKALALLDTIKAVNNNAVIAIKAENLRGGILLRQGKPDEARAVYQELLDNYDQKEYAILTTTHYKLALLYKTQSKFELALKEMNLLLTSINHSQNIELTADIYQFKGSLLLTMGRTKEAISFAQKSLELFTQTGNLTGLAKSHSVTARILKHQANYPEALEHLRQSLGITKKINFKFGTGAVLNEIIDLLITQGELNKAWNMNQEMQKIAIDIDFTAMLLASKKYTISIATIQNKWQTAQLYIDEHKQLAQAANNKRAVVENHLLQLDLDLKQNNTTKILPIIEKIQRHIDESQELRMQAQTNIFHARYYLLIKQQQNAISLLSSTLISAKDNDNGEAIIEINKLLGQIYLKNKQPNKVLTLLENSSQSDLNSYLLLKSKTFAQLEQLTKAIEYALTYKRTVNELWESKDEQYLLSLINRKKSATFEQ